MNLARRERAAPRRRAPPLSAAGLYAVALVLVLTLIPTSLGAPGRATAAGPAAGTPVPLAPRAVAPLPPRSAPGPAVPVDTWTNVSPGQRIQPPALAGSSLVYDPVDNYLVLFGGCSTTACPAPAQTWKYAGGAWTNISALGPQPPARVDAGMVFAAHDGLLVLFGGWAGPGRALDDTWEFLGGQWTNVTNASLTPSGRWSASMTYDRIDNEVVLFGGCSVAACPLSDTWRFSAGAWLNLTGTTSQTPPGRWGGGLAWDDADGYAVLLDGCGAAACPINDSWSFVRGKWAALAPTGPLPPARYAASIGYAATEGFVLLHGGNSSSGPLADTWKYVANRWTNLSATVGGPPTGLADAALVTSTLSWITGGTHRWPFQLLYGGADWACPRCGASASSATWAFEPSLSVTASPLPSVAEAGAPVVLAAAGLGGSPPYLFLWQFGDGSTGAGASATHAYPAAGNFTANVSATDLAGVTAYGLTAVTVLAGPLPTLGVNPPATDVGFAVRFSSASTGGVPPYVFRWAFGDLAGASTQNASHAYGAPGLYAVNVTVVDALQGVGVRAGFVTVHPLPSVSASVSASSGRVNDTLTFHATAVGGTPPVTYTWSFGDGNGSSLPSPAHAYERAGTFVASVRAVDAVGAQSTANLSVSVTAIPPPAVGGGTPPSALPFARTVLLVAGYAGAAAGAVVAAGLLLTRRRRVRPGPLAAAPMNQPGWDGDAEPAPSLRTSRSARRSARYEHR